MRLSLYDGNGLDLLQFSATENYTGVAVMLYLYMILSAIILLNALLGIFSSSFGADNDGDEGKGAGQQQEGDSKDAPIAPESERDSNLIQSLPENRVSASDAELRTLLLELKAEVAALRQQIARK